MARKTDDPAIHRRRMLVSVVVPLLIILATMPWPFMPYGRPLFRLP
jgi:hypothetical protein